MATSGFISVAKLEKGRVMWFDEQRLHGKIRGITFPERIHFHRGSGASFRYDSKFRLWIMDTAMKAENRNPIPDEEIFFVLGESGKGYFAKHWGFATELRHKQDNTKRRVTIQEGMTVEQLAEELNIPSRGILRKAGKYLFGHDSALGNTPLPAEIAKRIAIEVGFSDIQIGSTTSQANEP